MNKIFTLFALLAVSFTFSQQKFTLVYEDDSKLITEIKENQTLELQNTVLNNQNYIDFKKTHKVTNLEKSNPQLPVYAKSIIIPSKGNATVNVIYSEFELIENVNVLPSKGNLKRNINPDDVPYEFGAVYSENKFYPENNVKLEEAFNLRSIRGQVVRVFPYQYNPITKTLKHYTKIQIEISYNKEIQGLNELESTEINPNDAQQFARLFLNPSKQIKYNQITESGDLLIITPASYLDSIQKLVTWKKEKGINTKVITVAESGSTALVVKALIQTEYTLNPNLKYVLLVGDHQQIPAFSYGTTQDNEQLWSDSYYGQLTGNDYYPELFIGRFSGTTTHVSTMTKRSFEYETNPSVGDWMEKGLGLGSSEGAGYGDEDQADWQHLRGLRTQLLNFGYQDVYEFYDGSRGQNDATGNPNASIILPAVNNGIGLFNYTGHGDLNTCITGNFGTSQINQAVNNGKYPFVISVACNNGTFTLGNCISESWLKATKNGTPTGAIAACGSSILMAWAPPMQTQDGMTDLIVQNDQNNLKYTLGGLFYNGQMSMLEDYPSAGIEVMQTWVFFGDPSVDFRSKTTQDLAVTYDTCLTNTNNQTIDFSSTEDNVLVSLTQNQVSLAKGTILNGTLSLNVSNIDPNLTIKVTCSKANFKPLIGSISFGSNCGTEVVTNSGEVKVYPSPASNKLTLDLGQTTQNLDYMIYDVTGKLVAEYHNNQLNSNLKEIDVQNLANGLYSIVIPSLQTEEKIKFVVLK